MTRTWDAAAPGVLRLPSGRLLRGRGLRKPLLDDLTPDFAVYLLGKRPAPVAWDARWVRWPDFRLPTDRRDAQDALREAWHRAETERVEIACAGGRGRTGTALACIAVLDGVPGHEAVAFVRERYDAHAVETPWQRRYVTRFPAPGGSTAYLIGKPEPLKHGFHGYWSRRITDEHRLICKISEGEIRIAACRYHYGTERHPPP